jgi:DNA polymerase III delta' subunit
MKNAVTRGQPRGLAEIRSMVVGRPPHAVLLSGPGSVGKTTLALDLAAGLLCLDPDPTARPCRSCRGCRQLASGNHPDLHRLAPEGPGGQIKIGDASRPDPGTARHLIGALALLPVEGGWRVAIVEQADRLNDDAQNALLKVLEEPPPGVTIILCADDEECLLPTIRSRCARVRLSAVGTRDIEDWLGSLGAADAPQAARLARLSGGRPGLALAYARSSTAERLRAEIARGVVDMLSEPRQVRLASVRAMMKSAAALEAALTEARRGDDARSPAADRGGSVATRGRKPRAGSAAATAASAAASAAAAAAAAANGTGDNPEADAQATDVSASAGQAAKLGASERRAAAATLVRIWAGVARDLTVAAAGGLRQLQEVALLDDLQAIAPAVVPASLAAFMERLAAVDRQLGDNVNPELALDVLALNWPRVESAGTR